MLHRIIPRIGYYPFTGGKDREMFPTDSFHNPLVIVHYENK